nr:hypothetical protein GCM10020092_103290 [Actinoplanes digitatis]
MSPPPVPVRLTRRSYRKGSSGLQRCAFGTGTRMDEPTLPEAVPTTVPPVSTWAVTPWPLMPAP